MLVKQKPAPTLFFELPTLNLPEEDGVAMDSPWHRAAINLLVELIRRHWLGRTDFYVGADMFVYYSFDQAQAVAREVEAERAETVLPSPLPPEKRTFRGPDFFVVTDVDGARPRKTWRVWEEEGRYPDLIIELLSPSTAKKDLTEKKDLYERTFRASEYYCYDPDTHKLLGWRLSNGRYNALLPANQGRLWSEVMGLWLGVWEGVFQSTRAVWLRFFDARGALVLTGEEIERRRAEAERRQAAVERRRAEAERRQAAVERRRAEAAENEVARLRARLIELGDEA